MAGVLFIVNIPRCEYEEELRKNEKTTNISVEKDKYDQKAKMIDELKENKKFGNIKTNNEIYSHDDNIGMSKCKSTDCLHTNDKGHGLHKSKSESILNGNVAREEKTKSSWVKQVLKSRRTKLKITTPGRGVDILAAFQHDTPLEIILSEVIIRLDIKSAAWSSTKDGKFWKVIFSLESGNLCEELLQVLRTFGIGSRYKSSISVIPCALYYKNNHDNQTETERDIAGLENAADSAWSRFSSSVRARNNLAQILHDVRAEAALTFDWLFLLIVAAFVAAIGLVENSTVILVASMLISPLMGPITAGTLGTAVRDRSLQQMGVMHELLGLFLSLVIGFIFGLAICAVDEKYGVGDWPTYEMMSRCEIRSLWVGVLVAIPSGAGVALAVLGEYTASLVGVAISASLLPPAVNAGLLWAMALVHLIFMDDDTRWTTVVKTTIYSTNQPTELAVLGTVSLCLTLVNIICIFLAGVAVYKVKEVCPFERRDIPWWRTNKNFLRGSKRQRNEQEASTAWNIYSKWCNEVQEARQQESKDNTLDLIQSDTVTFRRHHPLAHRMRAQHIESYCNRNAQVIENYMSLDPAATINDNQNGIADINIEKSISTDSEISSRNRDSLNNGYNFYNMGFEDLNSNFEKDSKERPTLEPSLSLTVDSKKSGIVLNSKSFHV